MLYEQKTAYSPRVCNINSFGPGLWFTSATSGQLRLAQEFEMITHLKRPLE